MAMSSNTERENCRKFAKFCFSVIKNECSNIKRAAGIRKGYDATGEEPVEYLLELLSHEDAYNVEDLILNVDGKPKGIKYLGFGFYYDSFAKEYKARPYAKTVAKFKVAMRKLTRRSWGASNAYKVQKLNQLIRGWIRKRYSANGRERFTYFYRYCGRSN